MANQFSAVNGFGSGRIDVTALVEGAARKRGMTPIDMFEWADELATQTAAGTIEILRLVGFGMPLHEIAAKAHDTLMGIPLPSVVWFPTAEKEWRADDHLIPDGES